MPQRDGLGVIGRLGQHIEELAGAFPVAGISRGEGCSVGHCPDDMFNPSMPTSSGRVQKIYLLLLLLHTLAASFIWGINTLFLLDAGLSNTEAFAANAFFTAGMVIFEVPTGVVADTRGRRTSYLLGTLTLSISTVLYLLMWRIGAPFWGWALVSVLLGLGFTFFSGAVEAWLVDALTFTGYLREGGKLESVLARGEI